MKLTRIVTLALCFAGAVHAFGASFVIIANRDVNTSTISANELRQIFVGETKTLPDGTHVVPVTLASGSPAQAALLSMVGKTEGAFRSGWRKQVFEGKAAMPRSFSSEAAMVAFVAATPGAVGYVSSGEPSGVKVLALTGTEDQTHPASQEAARPTVATIQDK